MISMITISIVISMYYDSVCIYVCNMTYNYAILYIHPHTHMCIDICTYSMIIDNNHNSSNNSSDSQS